MGETYLKVPCYIRQVTRDAVMIAGQGSLFIEWVPLSLIHGADELKLRKAMRDDFMTIRIFEWKVRSLGLPTIR